MNEPNYANLCNMMSEIREGMRDIKFNQERTTEELQQLKKIITGESEPERGLVIRVDRLEQQSKKTNALSQAAFGTVIAAIIGAIMTAIGLKQ